MSTCEQETGNIYYSSIINYGLESKRNSGKILAILRFFSSFLNDGERERERERSLGAEVIRSTSQITFSNTYCSPFSLYARPVNSTAKPQLAIKTAETHVVKNWKSNFNIDGAAEAEPGRPHHADNVLPK